MEINKKDLKKIDRSFRAIASRTINSCHEEFDSILKMFIHHIDNESLIIDYIKTFEYDENDIGNVFQTRSHHTGFDTGSSKEEEIAKIYNILKYMVQNNIPVLNVCMSYANSNRFDDMVKGFANRVIFPFVDYITQYLMEISIDMGFDENESYKITVHGGQVNVAKDNSVINATQSNNVINPNDLQILVQNVRNAMNESSLIDNKDVLDCLDIITEEASSKVPKKNILNLAIRSLEGINGTAPFISAVASLVSAIRTLL